MQINLGAKNRKQALVVPWLLQEIARAAPHGFHGQLDAAPCRHYHDGKFAVEGLHMGEQIDSFLSGGGIALIVKVHQHNIKIVDLQSVQQGRGIVCGFDEIAFGLEEQT